MADGLARAGQGQQALAVAEQAITAARTIEKSSTKAQVLAGALAGAGQAEQARAVAECALTTAQTIRDAWVRAQA